MNKLTKTAKTLDKFCHVVQIIFTIVFVFGIICSCFMLLGYALGWGIATYSSGVNTLDIGILEMELTKNAVIDFDLAYMQGLVVLVLGSVCLFIGRQACRYIRAILHPMTEGQPFDNAVSTNLKKLANLSIFAGIFLNLTQIVEGVMTVFAFNLPDLMNPALVSLIGINFELDLTFLVCFGILRLLSYVFHYGEELQQLSDETV